MSLILIGMPGCGKTTVLNLFEKIYGERVYDTDCFIEARYGNINEIFARYGEGYFRDIESEAIKKICGLGDAALISTGGGAVLREENIRLLKSVGKIVYLKAKTETLLSRIKGDTSRPLLSGDTQKRLNELFEQRQSVYERVADIVIETDGLKPEEVLKKIIRTGDGNENGFGDGRH